MSAVELECFIILEDIDEYQRGSNQYKFIWGHVSYVTSYSIFGILNILLIFYSAQTLFIFINLIIILWKFTIKSLVNIYLIDYLLRFYFSSFFNYYYFEMTLNLGKQVLQKTTISHQKSQFLQKNKITINEPKQTHFSVEGVQAYSAQQIAALKIRQQRVKAKLQGQYIQPKAYKIDDQIEFDRPSTGNQQMRVTMKPKKNKKGQLQEEKPQVKVKPSIKNQLGRANQKLIKRDKNIQKKELYQKKLEELKQQYKKHFGDTIKSKDKPKKQISKNNLSQKSNHQFEIQQQKGQQFSPNTKIKKAQYTESESEQWGKGQIKLQQQQGQQCFPNIKKVKNFQTAPKAEMDIHSSFEQVQWQVKAKQIRRSIRKKSTNSFKYQNKLENAVHFLFD